MEKEREKEKEKEKEMEKDKQKHEQRITCQEAEATKRMLQQMQNCMKKVTQKSCVLKLLS